MKRKMSEETKVLLFRWWFVGAMYFFIGFGTALGNTTSAIDLIFFLGVGIGLGNIFIFHPIIYNMFTIRRRGEIANKRYLNRTISQNVSISLAEITRCVGVVILVYMTYQCLNMLLITITNNPEGTVLLPGEPILFGIFFVCYYILSDKVIDKFNDALDNISGKRGDK